MSLVFKADRFPFAGGATALALTLALTAGACGDDAQTVDGEVFPDAQFVDTVADTAGPDAPGPDADDDAKTADVAEPPDATPDTGGPDAVGPLCKTNTDCQDAFDAIPTCQIASCNVGTGTCQLVAAEAGTSCDDGDPCTTGDVCAAGSCAGEAKVCDDDNPCTDDACEAGAGKCVFTPNTQPCNDGSPCTTGDVCADGVCTGAPNPACQCEENADCAQFEDADLCNGTLICVANECVVDPATVVTCDAELAGECQVVACDPETGTCEAGPAAEGSACSDNSACTKQDKCVAGVCKGQTVVCDDDNACTDDTCAPATGCVFTPNTAPCDDGDPCTKDDTCAGGACMGEVNEACECLVDADCAANEDGDLCNGTLVCQDGQCVVDAATVVTCTGSAGACNELRCEKTTGQCVTKPVLDGASCDDGSACTKNDHCESGACVGAAVACSDEDPCTDDDCDPASGCVYAPATGAPCDDGNACTSGDQCVAGVCQGELEVGCGCETTEDCAPLEDGDACNGTLACVDGECVVAPGSVVTCSQTGLGPCLVNTCDPDTGACNKIPRPNGESCDDGSVCTTDDVCAAGVCKGKDKSCDDGNLCTTDSCDAAVGCKHAFNSVACDDGNDCTSGDVCKQGTCGGTPIPECVCATTADCAQFEDGNACNGTLVCSAGKCVVDPATVVTCAPAADACSANTCDPATGQCGLVPATDGKPCDDGDACTTGDACSAGACTSTGTLACDDGNPCTTDSCKADFGCVTAPNDAACDDGDPCTGGDTCAEGVCQPGNESLCASGCQAQWTLTCGSSDSWNTGYFDATDELTSYGCNSFEYPGGEYTYLFNAPYDGTFKVTLSNEETFTDVMILAGGDEGCQPDACVNYGFSSATEAMEQGEVFYLVVDGYLDEDGGYTIKVDCTPATESVCDDGKDDDADGLTDCADSDCAEAAACQEPQCEPAWVLSCGSTDSWSNYGFGSTDVLETYSCSGWPYPGPEYTYSFVSSVTGDVTISLTGESASTDVMVLQGGSGCFASACLAYGFSSVTFSAVEGETYFVVVDGYNGAEGTYTISVACPAAAEAVCDDGLDDDEDGLVDCEDPDCFGASAACQPACVPDTDLAAAMTCPSDVDSWSNDGAGSTNVVDGYGCNSFAYTGPEYVYTYVATTDTSVTVTLSDESAETDVLVLEDKGLGCNPASCLTDGLSSATFQATAGKTYYIVVDGYEGASGDYVLDFTCE